MLKSLWKWIIALVVLPPAAFVLFLGVVLQAAGSLQSTQGSGGCASTEATAVPTSPIPRASPTAGTLTLALQEPTPTVVTLAARTCALSSSSGAAVVGWARKMADALYVNPACGSRRGGACNDIWYTSAFPQPVIQYGQTWCQAHHDCADWADGSYQCVSFVRGAYSQVYPMQATNDAFGLWATYQHLPGWQEIPAAATADLAQRSLPEPGDVMVFKDLGVGHVAIVLAVQPPQDGTSGWIDFANANSSSAYDRMPLLPTLLVDTSEWAASGAQYTVWGYIRPQPTATHKLVRLNHLDPGQYASASEEQTWTSSACSAAAMTEVLNAYDRHLRIHEITPADGLLEDAGIARTMQHFGFQTRWGEQWSLSQVVDTANAGLPVIVSWPPDRYAGGHLVVVTGGDLATNTIELADSSRWDRQTLAVTQFVQWWAGFAAVSTPA